MAATILDGKAIAQQIQEELRGEIAQFKQARGVTPCLAVVLVGDDPASQVYVAHKQRGCERLGMDSRMHYLPAATAEDDVAALVARLNADAAVHGILLQLPVPKHIRAARLFDLIDPRKDVDALHPENVGRVLQGRPRFLPCTPHGIQQILHRSGIEVAGKHVVIVGRSDIVGKPMAAMLMQRDGSTGPGGVNATITVCHSRTADLGAVTRQAEILIVAIGQAELITGAMIRPGAVVIDVGTTRVGEKKLLGDVHFASACEVASAITPVPGGVGPLTVTMLLHNTLAAARGRAEG